MGNKLLHHGAFWARHLLWASHQQWLRPRKDASRGHDYPQLDWSLKIDDSLTLMLRLPSRSLLLPSRSILLNYHADKSYLVFVQSSGSDSKLLFGGMFANRGAFNSYKSDAKQFICNCIEKWNNNSNNIVRKTTIWSRLDNRRYTHHNISLMHLWRLMQNGEHSWRPLSRIQHEFLEKCPTEEGHIYRLRRHYNI